MNPELLILLLQTVNALVSLVIWAALKFILRDKRGTLDHKLFSGLKTLTIPGVTVYAASTAEKTDTSRTTLPCHTGPMSMLLMSTSNMILTLILTTVSIIAIVMIMEGLGLRVSQRTHVHYHTMFMSIIDIVTMMIVIAITVIIFGMLIAIITLIMIILYLLILRGFRVQSFGRWPQA